MSERSATSRKAAAAPRPAPTAPGTGRHANLEARPGRGPDPSILIGARDAGPAPVQRAVAAPNRTGLPAALKSGVEALSGVALDDVKVHFSSAMPARLGAAAFTRGTDIHVAAGQERHLAHEAWHVVQQKQGRVRPTLAVEGTPVNDEAHLEREADRMGSLASSWRGGAAKPAAAAPGAAGPAPVQRVIEGYKAKTLAANTVVMKGLTLEQQAKIQALHDSAKTYSIDEARKEVGAPPLDAPAKGHGPPLPFRYDAYGSATMTTVSSGSGGLVQTPMSAAMDTSEDATPQIAVAKGLGAEDLTKGSKRAVSQIAVMGNTSPNDAAKALKLAPGSWEWLHLSAFSIGVTHIPDLSAASAGLIKRTGQAQQISENLVLGSAAANTEMLSFETHLKDFLKKTPGSKLQLWVAARKETHKVEGVSISVGVAIQYSFLFDLGSNKYTPPVVVTFYPQEHAKPASRSYAELESALAETLKNSVTLKAPLKGISTDDMVDVKSKK